MATATPPEVITFIHGFTQTSKSWNWVMSQLENRFHCESLDAPGHGKNQNSRLTLPECGDFIARTMRPGILVGYSMGARMALHTALQHPNNIRALVLVSGTPGIESENDRLQRITSDNALADHIEEIGVHRFIDEWLSNPLFDGLTVENAQIEERLTNSAQGLADSLRYAGTGTQEPLWNQLHELNMPVLLVAGANDAKFVEIAQRMHSLIPHSQLCIIENSGHTVHLENPFGFLDCLQEFLLSV